MVSRVIYVAVMALVLSLSSLSAAIIGPFADGQPTKSVSDWQRLALRDEEFSMLTPVQPSMLIQPAGDAPRGGEKVLAYRAYSGYADGFIFVVESYKASRPQRLFQDLKKRLNDLEPLEEVKLNGFNGRKYRLAVTNYFGQVYHFVTVNHLYIVTLAMKDANHPSVARFVSSFALGNNDASTGDVLPRREDHSIESSGSSANAVTIKEMTVKAVVVWKPEPTYTEQARTNETTGTVVLRGVLTASGQVVIYEIRKGLKDGLTEKAIEVAKNIRFFPGEKDGRAIPLRIQFEYSFNLN